MTKEILILSIIFGILLILPFAIATIYLLKTKDKVDNVLKIDDHANLFSPIFQRGKQKNFVGNIEIPENTEINDDIREAKDAVVGIGCSFNTIYAAAIKIGKANEKEIPKPPYHEKGNPIIENTSYVVEKKEAVCSDIKSYGSITVEEGAMVYGNLFAEKNIVIGKNAFVTGIVFSQGEVYIHEGAVIGKPGEITSVIGKEKVTIAEGTIIHGYLHCERELMGKTVSAN